MKTTLKDSMKRIGSAVAVLISAFAAEADTFFWNADGTGGWGAKERWFLSDGSTAATRVGANLKIDNPPADENYHLYHLGRAPLVTHSKIWAHHSWLFQCSPRDAFTATPDYESDVWVSLKLQGPAYVKGSTKPNGAFIDRVIVARD